MMTNASPGDSPQLIGFLSCQNLGFIDHDKAARLGRRRINGQKETQRLRAFSEVTPPFSSFRKVAGVQAPTGGGRLFPPPESFAEVEKASDQTEAMLAKLC